MDGWIGRLLRVDLSSGLCALESLDPELAGLYLGGRGLGARLLFDEVGPEVGPLDPGNKLVFATGPLTGTPAPTAGRFSVSTLSPLTGTIFDANSGGKWGPALKAAGFDALVVQGVSDRPVVLEVDDGTARIVDGSHLWGTEVSATTAALEGRGRSVACIGPAGESLSLISAIMNDGTRALARGGVGAVMGSKRLKAIVVSGSRRPTIADEERFKFFEYESQKLMKASPITARGLPEFGTAVLVNVLNQAGALPARNYQDSLYAAAEAISGEALKERYAPKRTACWGCSIGCTRRIEVDGVAGEGPEYETIWALGANCGIDDLDAIIRANARCNQLGLDTISVGATIACAMELNERGHLPQGPCFGSVSDLLALVESIGRREGLGDDLADGSARLAARYGASQYAMQVKGLELPAYDPRGMQSQGLAYATSNRGGCHLRANMLGPIVLGLPKLVDRFNGSGQAGILIELQNLNAVLDSLVVCKFSHMALGEEHYARLLSAATGKRYEEADMLRVGERIWTLERLFNARRGFSAQHDTLPDRLLHEPASSGPARGMVVHLAPMLEEYYRFRGWTKEGIPTPRKLGEMGLAEEGRQVATC